MFFKKGKNSAEKLSSEITEQNIPAEETSENAQSPEPSARTSNILSAEETPYPYTFYKPEPYPKDLASVISKMLQRMFPDTRKAYLLEAQQNKKKGYLLIVDIEPKFLKIINIYLDSETKRVRGDIPIECVLYSKSGTLTEGIDPFYLKETAESKANNLASKEFSGDITFSDMPEFELWGRSEKPSPAKPADDLANKADKAADDSCAVPADKPQTSQPDEKEIITPQHTAAKAEETQPKLSEAEQPAKKQDEKPQTKVKPATGQELFSLLNEYGAKKSGAVSTIAMAAIKEYEFYIPYSFDKASFSNTVDTSLPIDDSLRFKKLINPDDEMVAVPLYTEKEDALSFAEVDNCRVVLLKYKDFASSRAAELTVYDGIVINPDDESIFLLSDHPLLNE